MQTLVYHLELDFLVTVLVWPFSLEIMVISLTGPSIQDGNWVMGSPFAFTLFL